MGQGQVPPLPRLLSSSTSSTGEGCGGRHNDDLGQCHSGEVGAVVVEAVAVVTHGDGGSVRLRGRGGGATRETER